MNDAQRIVEEIQEQYRAQRRREARQLRCWIGFLLLLAVLALLLAGALWVAHAWILLHVLDWMRAQGW